MLKLLFTLLLSASLFAETTTEPNKTPSLMECEDSRHYEKAFRDYLIQYPFNKYLVIIKDN